MIRPAQDNVVAAKLGTSASDLDSICIIVAPAVLRLPGRPQRGWRRLARVLGSLAVRGLGCCVGGGLGSGYMGSARVHLWTSSCGLGGQSCCRLALMMS